VAEVNIPEAVAACRRDPAMMSAVWEVLREADRAAAELGAVCLGGGACCKFDLFGHRLYVTPGELAVLTDGDGPPGDADRARLRLCPYQLGPACRAYHRRPLGCRLFFCRGAAGARLAEQAEPFHESLRSAHKNLCHPYAYAELPAMFLQLHPN
jgi:Fe-S-cluster containining protein